MTNLSILVVILLLWTKSSTGNAKNIMYTQQLDHFVCDELCNFTFPQKLIVDDSRWAGAAARAPIFAYLGGFIDPPTTLDDLGVLSRCAVELKAMIIYIEHRFESQSTPLGSIDLAMEDHKVRARLSTDQALEDFATIIESLKANLSAQKSPVIVAGAGYSGGLATWFRLKYPHIAIGALASSTPLFYYCSSTPGHGYCQIVSNDFKTVDRDCYNMIRDSWQTLDDIANGPDGLEKLSQVFNTCRPVQSLNWMKQLFAQLYSYTAQYDDPNNLLIQSRCNDLTVQPSVVQGLFTALYGQLGGKECFDNNISELYSPFEPFTTKIAWTWLRCTELIYPIGCVHDTMLPSWPFNMTQFEISCQKRFGIVRHLPSPNNFYGSRDTVVKTLIESEGNIIFSNGNRDPFCSGAILTNLSKTIVALTSTKGTFSLDLFQPITKDDPSWLIEKREKEVKIFQSWINQFHHISKGSHNSPFYVMIYILELLVLLFMYL